MKAKEPRALEEVWEWKDACRQDVAHLPRREALRRLVENANRAAEEVGFNTSATRVVRAMVADERSNYGRSNRAGK